MADDEDWIELGRFDDPLRAEMTKDFLTEHGVAVRMRGNVGGTSVLNRFNTVMDIRLDVPTPDLEPARETLLAMEAGDAVEHAFRGRVPVAPADEDRYVPPRRAATAMMLGFLVPIGAAHFYARHGAAGAILFAGVVAAALGILLAGRVDLVIAWAILVVADVAGARAAVRRCNEGRVPAEARQRGVALAVVMAAFAVAMLVGRAT